MSGWPAVGDRVVVWTERTPSRVPREPHEAVIDHVAGRTFTVSGLDAVFNRSTGRSKPIRQGEGAFATVTFVAVDAHSQRASDVLAAAQQRDLSTPRHDARSTPGSPTQARRNRRAVLEAFNALDEPH